MPRFAANISWLYTEYALLDRFAAAADDGFEAVELLFPYDHTPEALARAREAAGVSQVLINMPPGDWDGGERGLGALPGREAEFAARGTQVLGVSTDTQFVHLAWRRENPMLRELPFPMLADTKRELSSALGVLHRDEGVPLRATFVVDPEGTIRHVSVNDLAVGRSVDEVLRILDGLQSGELTPCNWQPGQPTLKAS